MARQNFANLGQFAPRSGRGEILALSQFARIRARQSNQLGGLGMRLSPVFSACAAFCLAIAAATYPWVAQLFIMAIGFAALIDAVLDLGWGIVKKSRRRRERLAKPVVKEPTVNGEKHTEPI